MIALTGGSGNIGRHLVRLLGAANQEIRVLARDVDRARTVLGEEVTIAAAASPDALTGVEKLFYIEHASSQLATAAEVMANAARAAGVKHIVAISSGTIDMKPPVALGHWHAALEGTIMGSGCAHTFLRPGNFASNTLRWAASIRAKSMVFVADTNSTSAPVDPYDIAAVAAVALTQPGHEGKTYTVQGPQRMSARDQVSVIGAALGRSLQIVGVPPQSAREGMMRGGMAEEMADAIIELLRSRDEGVVGDVLAVTGNAPRDFGTWVKDHRRSFA